MQQNPVRVNNSAADDHTTRIIVDELPSDIIAEIEWLEQQNSEFNSIDWVDNGHGRSGRRTLDEMNYLDFDIFGYDDPTLNATLNADLGENAVYCDISHPVFYSNQMQSLRSEEQPQNELILTAELSTRMLLENLEGGHVIAPLSDFDNPSNARVPLDVKVASASDHQLNEVLFHSGDTLQEYIPIGSGDGGSLWLKDKVRSNGGGERAHSVNNPNDPSCSIKDAPTCRKPRTHSCPECNKRFSLKQNLTQHLRIHTGEKPYKCDVCNRSFAQSSNLNVHLRSHTGDKPYKCDVCDQTFSNKRNLIHHSRIHTGEKPYKCDVCDQSFSQSSNLVAHLRIHMGKKPHKCDVCDKSFAHRSNLYVHLRIHTDRRPYKCEVCNQSFRSKNILIEHSWIHTGERPYKCMVCEARFRQKGNLSRHSALHSGEKHSKCEE